MKKIFKILLYIISFLIGIFVLILLISLAFSFKTYPISYGISFNQQQAQYLNGDWKKVYEAMLTELKPPYIRIAAMWSEVEPVQGQYDFADVDWMMNRATEAGTKVLLVVGQKAPRWPECHVPEWVSSLESEAQHDLQLAYVQQVVERYHNHPALEWWQVENEPFIGFKFGDCAHYDQQAIYDEIQLVQSIDGNHKIVVTDSGELSTWRKSTDVGDIFGTTLYRIVRTPQNMIFRYDWLPAGFYYLKSRMWGKTYNDFIVAELQAEPWFTDGSAHKTPLTTQEETMNIERLEKHIEYVTRIGASRAYLWGVEWWYWMKEKEGDARYWEMVGSVVRNSEIKK